MPLFKSSHTSPPPTTTSTRTSTSSPRRSIFSSHRSSQETDATSTTTHGSHHSSSSRGFFGRHKEDPSVSAARQRVASAEAAERDADRAKAEAGRAVRDAKLHVKQIESEAAEEARLAKAKQKDASLLGRRANPLGPVHAFDKHQVAFEDVARVVAVVRSTVLQSAFPRKRPIAMETSNEAQTATQDPHEDVASEATTEPLPSKSPSPNLNTLQPSAVSAAQILCSLRHSGNNLPSDTSTCEAMDAGSKRLQETYPFRDAKKPKLEEDAKPKEFPKTNLILTTAIDEFTLEAIAHHLKFVDAQITGWYQPQRGWAYLAQTALRTRKRYLEHRVMSRSDLLMRLKRFEKAHKVLIKERMDKGEAVGWKEQGLDVDSMKKWINEGLKRLEAEESSSEEEGEIKETSPEEGEMMEL